MVRVDIKREILVLVHCHQACELKLRKIDERLKALQRETSILDRRDNELLADKKNLSELKGKKRQLEQKISTKQDRSASPNVLKGLCSLDSCLIVEYRFLSE